LCYPQSGTIEDEPVRSRDREVVLRVAYHKARHLIQATCDRCFGAIDTDDDYRKYVAVLYGQFYWSCTHTRCLRG
jgi:hypothetical protein